MKKWYFPVSDLNKSRRIRKSIKQRKLAHLKFFLALLDQKIGNWGERKLFEKKGQGKSHNRKLPPLRVQQNPYIHLVSGLKTKKTNCFWGLTMEVFFRQTLTSATRLVPCGDAIAYRENCLIAILTRVWLFTQKCYRQFYF